jgi:hypothetical protein
MVSCSLAAIGTVTTVIGWFILPEVATRTPAEIDEMGVLCPLLLGNECSHETCSRFEKKISPRKSG